MKEEIMSKIKYSLTVSFIGIIISLIFLVFEILRHGSIMFWALLLICNLILMMVCLMYAEN